MDASRIPEEFPTVPLPIAKEAAPRREMPVSTPAEIGVLEENFIGVALPKTSPRTEFGSY
jgi:hypothetical protein